MKQTALYKTKNTGFTIVELLIVVVVIAILAAITIVSYNGISQRAQDSVLVSASKELEKKTEVNSTLLFSGHYGPLRPAGSGNGSLYETRAELINGMELGAFSSKLCIINYDYQPGDGCGDGGLTEGQIPQYDKTKIHMSVGGSPNDTYVRWAYWDNTKKVWHATLYESYYDQPKSQVDHRCSPMVETYENEFAADCRYSPNY